MKELVKTIAQAIVDHPDEVQVSEIGGNSTSVLQIKVAKSDLGQLIGKRGRNAQSIRTILNAAATKVKRKVVLDIME